MADETHEVLEPHLWHQRIRMPQDQRHLGLDARTEEGALVEFASSLDSTRRGHRIVAWVLLVAFGIPAVMSLLHLLSEIVGALR